MKLKAIFQVIQLVNLRFDAAVSLDQAIDDRINEANENDNLTDGSVLIGDETIDLIRGATQGVVDFIRANRLPRNPQNTNMDNANEYSL